MLVMRWQDKGLLFDTLMRMKHTSSRVINIILSLKSKNRKLLMLSPKVSVTSNYPGINTLGKSMFQPQHMV